MSDIKISDDSEFKCLRRISCLLGLSMPESDEDFMTLSTLRFIERGLKSAFKEENAQLKADKAELLECLIKSTSDDCQIWLKGKMPHDIIKKHKGD